MFFIVIHPQNEHLNYFKATLKNPHKPYIKHISHHLHAHLSLTSPYTLDQINAVSRTYMLGKFNAQVPAYLGFQQSDPPSTSAKASQSGWVLLPSYTIHLRRLHCQPQRTSSLFSQMKFWQNHVLHGTSSHKTTFIFLLNTLFKGHTYPSQPQRNPS